MATTLLLELDTTAPVITWGPVDGAVASEEMTVLYTINEPVLVSAELVLVGGAAVPMTVAADRLTVEIPDDALEGTAYVRALVRDDVLNEEIRELAVHITGTLADTGRLRHPPVGPDRHIDRIVSAPSGASVESSYRTRAHVQTTSTVRSRSRYTHPTRRRIVTPRGRVHVTSASWTRAAVRPPGTAVATGSTATVTKRPEGPGAEDDLAILGII